MIQIPKTIEPFSFTIEGKSFGRVLKLCDEVIKFSDADKMVEDSHLIVSTGKDVYLIGKTIDTFLIHKLPATNIDGRGVANTDFKSFLSLERRGTLKLDFGRKSMSAQARNFKMSIDLKQVTLDRIEMIEVTINSYTIGEGAEQLPEFLADEIRRAVQLTYVPDIYMDAPVVSGIIVKDSTLKVLTSSNWCASVFHRHLDGECADMRLSLSAKMLSVIYKIMKGADSIHLSTNGSSFIASSEEFTLVLPSVRSSDDMFDKVDNLLASLGSPSRNADISSDLATAVNSIRQLVQLNSALKDKTVPFQLTVAPPSEGKRFGSATLAYAADGQSTSERVKCSATEKFSIKCDVKILALVFKNLASEFKAHMPDHKIDVFGPVGKYKAYRLNYSNDGAHPYALEYLLMCLS